MPAENALAATTNSPLGTPRLVQKWEMRTPHPFHCIYSWSLDCHCEVDFVSQFLNEINFLKVFHQTSLVVQLFQIICVPNTTHSYEQSKQLYNTLMRMLKLRGGKKLTICHMLKLGAPNCSLFQYHAPCSTPRLS